VKKTKSCILIPVTIFAVTLIALNIYSALTITAFYFILFLLFNFKKDIAAELLVAILFALFITSYQKYTYTEFNFYIGTINVFPLILWSLGLVVLREVYEAIGNKFIISVFIYLILLIILEIIGYHLLGIHTTWNYPGLFGLDIIHGPPVIQYFYVLAGPVYLIVTKILKTP